jgi:hypothetical protein
MKNLLIMPAYNEQDALPDTVASLSVLPDHYDVLIINDGSRDRTAAIAANLARNNARKIYVANMPVNSGVGATMQAGYRFAAERGDYDYAIQFDADGQHDAAYIETLVATCSARELDLCVGSRFLNPQLNSFGSTPSRMIGIRLMSWLVSTLLGTRITDPTGGFRCAGRRAYRCFAEYYPEEYAEPESLFWLGRHGLKVAEVGVRMHARQGGVSSMHRTKEIYYMFKVSLALLVDRLRRPEPMIHETQP